MKPSKMFQIENTSMTIDQASAARARCEQQILGLLRQLCAETGLDLVRVEALTVVQAEKKNGDEPHQVPMSVRITLAV